MKITLDFGYGVIREYHTCGMDDHLMKGGFIKLSFCHPDTEENIVVEKVEGRV